jgi:CheY-like chemotaxis protein/nitrogen-specific signal transduction histidine kinase
MPSARRKTRARARKVPGRRASTRGRRAIEIALAGLAHDIRTPLTGILALADLLQASDLPARERRWAEAIKDSADHLARLTTIVVDAARAEAAGLVLHDQGFSPRELARSVAGSLAARAEAKGLAVDVMIAGRLPDRASGDVLRLRSALENLVDNAVKFTERGRIGFRASSECAGSERLRLTFVIADSGIGMTAADLKRLFRPFAQASEEVAHRYGGAGLGLVFVKRIAKAMGGDLAVTSKPGRGSSFTLTATVARAPRTAARRGAVPTGAPTGLRVLCVEDNPYGRIVLKAMLGELGHRVSFLGSGEAALEAAARGEHDVILMDLALPGIDGIEATRRIRALPPPAGRVPVIGLSGRTEAGDEAAARAAGMDLYLRKPASPSVLNEALRAVAGVRRA